jgi:ABC-type Fe3+ transport system substrate-binding protein
MSEVLVYAAAPRMHAARTVLAAACQATGISAQLEVFGTGAMYQRLGPRHAPPLPDLVLWFGAVAADAAAMDGLLQPHQPARLADGAVHDPGWRWTTLDFTPIGWIGRSGSAAVTSIQDLAAVPTLAVADPERSEVGLSIMLAMLDRARQVESDVERGWSWWQERVSRGIALAEDDERAVALVGEGMASHALSLAEVGMPMAGLAPIPNAIGLAANARNVVGARRLLDWVTGEQAATALRRSPWRASSNGLQALLAAAPPLDLGWCRQQYTASRRRWALSGMGPVIAS